MPGDFDTPDETAYERRTRQSFLVVTDETVPPGVVILRDSTGREMGRVAEATAIVDYPGWEAERASGEQWSRITPLPTTDETELSEG